MTARLSAQLRQLAALADAGHLPEPTAERLADAASCATAAAAIRRVGELLDTDATMTRTARAMAVEAALRRFEGTAWRHIRRELRAPRGPLEEALAEVLRSPAICRGWRRIYDLLPCHAMTEKAR